LRASQGITWSLSAADCTCVLRTRYKVFDRVWRFWRFFVSRNLSAINDD
jgi:hypothetical protein